ncbi:MAG: type II toxin-antitoxin system YafQ family toxin [Sphingobacteriales bacterium]|nr:MAG: type II toxin-antitoxin system YafQ family toxin [Sphingobacteriales bacterium]
MYQIVYAQSFKKDYKRCKKRNCDMELLKLVLEELFCYGKLPIKYKPHKLIGDYKNRWECHLKPDWLMIWKQNDDDKIIYLERLGTHSDLF